MATEILCADVAEPGAHPSAEGRLGSAQSLTGVQMTGGVINVVGGNQIHHEEHHYHQHNHLPLQPTHTDIPAILDGVPNYRDIHTANLGRATLGTGPRFSEWDEFGEWTNPQGLLKAMWGSGMPGAGKTIFASIVINEVESRAQAVDSPVSVGYIYFRYSDHMTATVRDFLMVLVKQTIERHSRCLLIFNQMFARHVRERSQPSEDELLRLLHRFAQVMAATFYFLEALDEAPINIQLDLLKRLSSLHVKLFITSRPLPSLEPCLPGVHRFPIVAQDRDLDLHINKAISHSTTLETILKHADLQLREKIMMTIKRKSGGMFLHASLQLDALGDCTSVSDVEKTLEDFPQRVEDVYQRTWDRILDQTPGRTRLAQHVLAWVLCATRSLKIEELRRVVATCPSTHKFDPNRLVDEGTLIGLCRGLVSVEEETKLVRFVHYTAKDAVKRLIFEAIPQPHSILAMTCMALLQERGFQSATLDSDHGLMMALLADPLLAYAYGSWSHHAHEALANAEITTQLAVFIQGCHAFPIVLKIETLGDRFDRLKPLHTAVYFNFPISFAGPFELREPNQCSCVTGILPLILAILRKSPSAVKELLALPGILVNAADEDGRTPLMWALRGTINRAIVNSLFTHPDLDVNLPSYFGSSALMQAATYDAEEATTLLLSHPKIEPNQVDSGGCTSLMLASRNGSRRVVRVLVADPRVEVNLKVGAETALDMARTGARTTFDAEQDAYNDIIEVLLSQSEYRRRLQLLKRVLRRALPST
ncbi:hypothetical protein BKA70DRAFT_136350 [Coprinopsis sp. MPI-PUGE-AT-0042]|nr:hypothetical protein BKA70DRAFT_136350 [Coprinopsis sp. MPI-PUGE-AT-0042]